MEVVIAMLRILSWSQPFGAMFGIILICSGWMILVSRVRETLSLSSGWLGLALNGWQDYVLIGRSPGTRC